MKRCLLVMSSMSGLAFGMSKEIPSLQFSTAQVIKNNNLDIELLPTDLKQYVDVLRKSPDHLAALKHSIWRKTSHSKDLIISLINSCQTKKEKEQLQPHFLDCAAQAVMAENNEVLGYLSPHLNVNSALDKRGTTLLMIAAGSEDNQIIQTLLNHGADIHIESKPPERTLLMHAARANNGSFVNYLINKKMDINKRIESETALSGAIQSNAEQSARYLIKKGAAVCNVEWQWSCSPLSLALNSKNEKLISQLNLAEIPITLDVLKSLVRFGSLALLKQCIDRVDVSIVPGCNQLFREICYRKDIAIPEFPEYLRHKKLPIDAKDELGDTPLHTTVSYANMPLIEFLLNNGANVHGYNSTGRTPLTIAVENQYDSITHYLLEKFPIQSFIADKQEEVLLKDLHANYCQIKKNGITSLLKKLLATQNLSFHADATNAIPTKIQLLSAIVHDDLSLFTQLCDQENVPINEPLYHHGTTLLVASIFFDAKNIFDYLLKKGADPIVLDYLHQTALAHAAMNANSSCVQALLDKGVPVDVRHESHYATPLFLAIQARNSDTALKLLEQGANVDITLCDYRSFLENAIDGNLIGILDELLERYMHSKNSYEISKGLAKSAADNNLSLCKRLAGMFEGASDDANLKRQIFARTLLAAKGQEIMEYLVDKVEVDPFYKKYDETSFMQAVRDDNNALVQSWVTKFSNRKNSLLNSTDTLGYTPLMHATKNNTMKMVSLLLFHGADIFIKNKGGRDALIIARLNGYKEIERLIRQEIVKRYED